MSVHPMVDTTPVTTSTTLRPQQSYDNNNLKGHNDHNAHYGLSGFNEHNGVTEAVA